MPKTVNITRIELLKSISTYVYRQVFRIKVIKQ